MEDFFEDRAVVTFINASDSDSKLHISQLPKTNFNGVF